MGLDGKNILITGGAGAIGGALAFRLAKISDKVMVLDDLSSGHRSNVPDNVEFIKGSILDDGILSSVFGKGIIVFHLAACFANQNSIDHPVKDLAVNGLGTVKLLEYAVKYKADKFIYASSSCVEGLKTPYALSKKVGEDYVFLYNKQYSLDTTILRYYNSYGPGDRPGKYRSVIPNFLHCALKGKDITITGHGTETRDFTYVEDVVDGTVLACLDDTGGRLFNIGSGIQTKIIDLACMIKDITKSSSNIVFTSRRDWDTVICREADISQTRKRLSYQPKISLCDGLQKTANWLKEDSVGRLRI